MGPASFARKFRTHYYFLLFALLYHTPCSMIFDHYSLLSGYVFLAPSTNGNNLSVGVVLKRQWLAYLKETIFFLASIAYPVFEFFVHLFPPLSAFYHTLARTHALWYACLNKRCCIASLLRPIREFRVRADFYFVRRIL